MNIKKIVKLSKTDAKKVIEEVGTGIINIEGAKSFDYSNLSLADRNKQLEGLELIIKHNNQKYQKKYNNYIEYYNKLSIERLEGLGLFSVSKSTKTSGFKQLNFNPAVNCCIKHNFWCCDNCLRCYSQRVEKQPKTSILKMVARQHVIFNKLSVKQLVNKFNEELSIIDIVRFCNYGFITETEFIKLLKVIDGLEMECGKIPCFYIYLEQPFKIPLNLKRVVNESLIINSSNLRTYNSLKVDGIRTNMILSTDERDFKKIKALRPEYFNFCKMDCKNCGNCFLEQNKPILFKYH